jgi:3-oxoadipate enol-lactonase
MIVTANGIDLYVEQRGAGAPALVFLHYWGGSARTWDHVIDRLTPDFRTIAMDQRGWGRSAAPADGYGLADLAADALGVIAALDPERYILVGHSMGGKVAQWIAAQQPEGLAGLALVAPAPPTALALPLAVRQGMVQAYATRESIMATVAHALAPDGLRPQDMEQVVADSLAGAMAARQAWPLATSQEDITGAMARITVPVLVISGAHDRVDPPAVLREELLTRLPQAQMHVLPQVGHLAPLEAPEDLADLLRAFALSIGEEAGPQCDWCGVDLMAATRRRIERRHEAATQAQAGGEHAAEF